MTCFARSIDHAGEIAWLDQAAAAQKTILQCLQEVLLLQEQGQGFFAWPEQHLVDGALQGVQKHVSTTTQQHTLYHAG